MERERIEYLIEKGALTPDEKSEIEQAAKELGLSYTINHGCRECYDKLLLRLYEFEAPQPNVSPDGYRLKNTTANLTIGGKVVNNATIKAVEVGKFSKKVIQKYFEDYED